MAWFKRNRAVAVRSIERKPVKGGFGTKGLATKKMPFFSELATSIKVDWAALGKGLKTFQSRDVERTAKINGFKCIVTVSANPIFGKILVIESGLTGKPMLDKQKMLSLAERLSVKKEKHDSEYTSSEINGVVPVGNHKVLVKGTLNDFEGSPSLTLRLSPMAKVFGKAVPLGNSIANIRYSEIADKGREYHISILGQKFVPGTPNFAVLQLIEQLVTK